MSNRIWLALALLALGLVAAAAQAPKLPAQPEKAVRPPLLLGLDLYIPIPEDNPLTADKVALGRRLFFDPILSRDYSLSCGTCHDPRRTFTDGLPLAVGVDGRTGNRGAPALLNKAWGKSFFWDGRAATLEAQALMPIDNPDEFDMTIEGVLQRLRGHADYPDLFAQAFGREAGPKLTSADLGRAIASYVRTILSGDAPIDRYMSGDHSALSVQARAGLKLFRGKANCTACHIGPTFTDEQFHNTGVAFKSGEPAPVDEGRYIVTEKEEHHGAFKTPTLRHVAETAPYMHDGSLKTLEEVITLYDQGGRSNPRLDEELRPLKLTPEEKQALLAFLRALTGTVQEGLVR